MVFRDLRRIDWTVGISGSSDGILPKAKVGNKYYKLSSFDRYRCEFYGIESIIEVINSRIGKILDVPVLEYKPEKVLVKIEGKIYETIAAVSADYCKGRQSISLEKLYGKSSTKDCIAFIQRYGFSEAVSKQFLYDFIICNLDRHGKNNDVLIKGGKCKLAPFFDNSLTFVTNRPLDEMRKKVTYNDNMQVNNFLGSRKLVDNLRLIGSLTPIIVREPRKEDRRDLFKGLGNDTRREFRDYVWWLLGRRVSDVKKEGISFIMWK